MWAYVHIVGSAMGLHTPLKHTHEEYKYVSLGAHLSNIRTQSLLHIKGRENCARGKRTAHNSCVGPLKCSFGIFMLVGVQASVPRFGLHVQDLVGRLSGSGEHFSLRKGAHGCKSRLLIL